MCLYRANQIIFSAVRQNSTQIETNFSYETKIFKFTVFTPEVVSYEILKYTIYQDALKLKEEIFQETRDHS